MIARVTAHGGSGRWQPGRAVAALGLAGMAVVGAACCGGMAAASEGFTVEVERTSDQPLTGILRGVDGSGVRLEVDGVEREIPLASIRRVVRDGVEPPPPPAVGIGFCDGTTLAADAFVWESDVATIRRGDGTCTLPIERVRWLTWPAAGAPAWLELLPAPLDGDVVVVAGDVLQCVACAVTGVTADAVTVVLDGETIPVQRGKVAGVHWLRPDEPRGSIVVAVRDGALTARDVAWSPDGLLLDGVVRMPSDWLLGIDYASGRSVALTDLEPERVDVEPFFAGLVEIDGLASFFAPRSVAADADAGTPGGLVLRPRTRAVWRLPPAARRFRAVVMPQPAAVARAGAAFAVVAVAVDGRDVVREEVTADAVAAPAGRAIEVDVAEARRIEIRVDFPEAGGMGGAVLLGTPVIEQ
jgi:hypothetical protein